MDLRRQRIHQAQRAGLRNRVRDQWRISEERADTLLDDWEAAAQAMSIVPGAVGYWDRGEKWLRERLDQR